MIKFFRRIRQKLLSDNKISKYLIYALGEIALVMIGILLALQVNNWNQNHKNVNKELAFLQRLQSDIVADTLMLNNFLNIVNTKDKCLRSIHNGTISNFQYNKTSQSYDIFLTRFNSIPIISDNTYLEITSSGNWDIIKDIDLKEQIFDYYRFNRNRASALESKFSEWPKMISQLMPPDGVYDPGYSDDYELPQDQIDRTIAKLLLSREMLIPYINAELQYTVKQKVSFVQLKQLAMELLYELDKVTNE